MVLFPYISLGSSAECCWSLGEALCEEANDTGTTENPPILSTELRLRVSSIVSESLMVVGVIGTEEPPSLTGELFTDARDTFSVPHCRRLSKLVQQNTHNRC